MEKLTLPGHRGECLTWPSLLSGDTVLGHPSGMQLSVESHLPSLLNQWLLDLYAQHPEFGKVTEVKNSVFFVTCIPFVLGPVP